MSETCAKVSGFLIAGLACQYLLISGTSGEWIQGNTSSHWTLLLEREIGSEDSTEDRNQSGLGLERSSWSIQSLPEAIGSPGFSPNTLHSQFGIQPNPKSDGECSVKLDF